MPSLIQKWNTLKDDDKDLFPLLEVTALMFLFVAVFYVCAIYCYTVLVVSGDCPSVRVLALL